MNVRTPLWSVTGKTTVMMTGILFLVLSYPLPSTAYEQDAFKQVDEPIFVTNRISSRGGDGFYPTTRLPFEVRRVQHNQSDTAQPFGTQGLSYNMRIAVDQGGDVVANGDYLSPSVRVYRKTISRGYIRAPGLQTDLRIEADSSFTEIEPASNMEFHYDTGGLLEEIRDKNGNSISITRNSEGDVTSVTDGTGRDINFNYIGDQITKTDFSSGGSIEYEYVTVGCQSCEGVTEQTKISKITDLVGNVTTFSYSAEGKLESQSNPALGTTNFEFDGIKVNVTDSDGELIARVTIDTTTGLSTSEGNLGLKDFHLEDFRGLTTSETTSRGTYIFTDYDADWNPIRIENNSDTIKMTWGEQGELKSAENSLGETRTYEYDNFHHLTEVLYVGGETESFVYNDSGNIVTQILPNGGEITFEYDGSGNRIEITDADNVATNFEYNDFGFVITQTNCVSSCGTARFFGYDSYGWLVITGNGIDTVVMTRDAIGRELVRLLPGGGLITTAWSGAGPIQVAKNGVSGDTVSYEYNGGRVLATIDALGNRQEFNYAGGGLVQTSFMNSLGDLTTYTYDSASNLSGLTWPANPLGTPKREWQNDSMNRLVKYTRETGDIIEYEHDALGRILKRTVNSVVVAEYTFDSRGRMTKTEDQLGVTKVSRNSLGQATRIEYPNGASIDWTYSLGGRVIDIDAGGNYVSTFGYDSKGRLGSLGTEAGDVEYSYDSAGRVYGMSYPNGVEAVYMYGATGRMERIEYRNVGSETIIFDIERDSMGLILQTYRSDLGETMNLSYSQREEVIGANITDGAATLAYRYDYDSTSNRIQLVSNGETTNYEYDPGNLLDSGAKDYDYNLAGEVTAIGDRDISYNAEGMLKTDTTTEGTVTYDYDAYGNRSRATINGEKVWRLWDHFGNEIADADESGNVSEFRYYVPKNMDALIGFTRGDSTYFTLSDPQGNIAIVVDENAKVVAQYAYTPFQKRDSAVDGINEASFDSIDNRFRFAKRREEKSGEVYIRARSLEAATGRFMQRDPLFIGTNSDPFSWNGFIYADNDAVNKKDPTGYCTKDIDIGTSNDNAVKTFSKKLYGNTCLHQQYTTMTITIKITFSGKDCWLPSTTKSITIKKPSGAPWISSCGTIISSP